MTTSVLVLAMHLHPSFPSRGKKKIASQKMEGGEAPKGA
jgi:hypothetical protein